MTSGQGHVRSVGLDTEQTAGGTCGRETTGGSGGSRGGGRGGGKRGNDPDPRAKLLPPSKTAICANLLSQVWWAIQGGTSGADTLITDGRLVEYNQET